MFQNLSAKVRAYIKRHFSFACFFSPQAALFRVLHCRFLCWRCAAAYAFAWLPLAKLWVVFDGRLFRYFPSLTFLFIFFPLVSVVRAGIFRSATFRLLLLLLLVIFMWRETWLFDWNRWRAHSRSNSTHPWRIENIPKFVLLLLFFYKFVRVFFSSFCSSVALNCRRRHRLL